MANMRIPPVLHCKAHAMSHLRVGHMAYAFGFLSMAIHSLALAIIVFVTVRLHISKQKKKEKFTNLDQVRSRVCMVTTNNPDTPFSFTAPDIPALRSIPGSPGECYFLRSPADAGDVDCTRLSKWNIPTDVSDMVSLSSKIVNGASRCVLKIKQGEAAERYAALQKQMVLRNEGVADLEKNIANEKELTAKLERDLMLSKEKLQQLKNAPPPTKDVCQSKSRSEEMKKNASYLQGVKNHLTTNILSVESSALDNESQETLATLLESVCNTENNKDKINRCDALKVSSILKKNTKEWTSSDRVAVMTSLRIVGGAAPGSTASNDDLRTLLKNICTSTSNNRCARLHPVYSKILKDKSYTHWTQEDRNGVLMLIWAHTGFGLQHLGNDVLAVFAERLCASSSNTQHHCYHMGGEMMPPMIKEPDTWTPAETQAVKTLISSITGNVPNNQMSTKDLKRRLEQVCTKS